MIKSYLIGLLTIIAFIQPWFFGKFIGLNMDFGTLSYAWAILIEFGIIFTILSHYLLGKKIRNLFND